MAISFYGIFYLYACQLRKAEFARIAPNIFCTHLNRYLEKKIIDISEQYLVLEADILQNKWF